MRKPDPCTEIRIGPESDAMSVGGNATSGNGRATPKGNRPDPPTEPTSCLSVVRMSDIVAKPVNWLWKGWPLGKVHLMVGMPESASLTRLATWPRGSRRAGRGPMRPMETVRPMCCSSRLRMGWPIRSAPGSMVHGADCEKVHVLRSLIVTTDEGKRIERPVSLIRDIERVDEHLRLNPAIRVLVVDPISEYLPGINHNKNEEVRTALAPLSEWRKSAMWLSSW